MDSKGGTQALLAHCPEVMSARACMACMHAQQQHACCECPKHRRQDLETRRIRPPALCQCRKTAGKQGRSLGNVLQELLQNIARSKSETWKAPGHATAVFPALHNAAAVMCVGVPENQHNKSMRGCVCSRQPHPPKRHQ